MSESQTQETAALAFIALSALPPIGAALDAGKFVGLTTRKDGVHCAAVLLPDVATAINWDNAKTWAQSQGGELPSRPVAALLFANVKDQLSPRWHWTSDEDDASFAWGCDCSSGIQYDFHKSSEGSAVAVRLIPLAA